MHDAFADCECHTPSCLQPTLTKQQQASVTVRDVEALVHAAGKLLESSGRAVLAIEDAALQRMEVTVRQYFQQHQADGLVKLLGCDTLEADVHAAAKMCLKAAVEAKMAGTSFCGIDALQQLLHNVFEQWVIHLNVLGSPEQVHRILHDARCRGHGVLDCVLQIQQANHECNGRAEHSYVAAHRQAAPLYASSSSYNGSSSKISAPVAASPAAYTPTRSVRAQSPVPVTPPRSATTRLPRTNQPQPHFVSADGSEALGSRGGKMHLNRNGNWTRSASQPHQARNGPNGEPAYTDADKCTGIGARGGIKSLNSKGKWVYDSSRKKK